MCPRRLHQPSLACLDGGGTSRAAGGGGAPARRGSRKVLGALGGRGRAWM